jgi:hypothetical protein
VAFSVPPLLAGLVSCGGVVGFPQLVGLPRLRGAAPAAAERLQLPLLLVLAAPLSLAAPPPFPLSTDLPTLPPWLSVLAPLASACRFSLACRRAAALEPPSRLSHQPPTVHPGPDYGGAKNGQPKTTSKQWKAATKKYLEFHNCDPISGIHK